MNYWIFKHNLGKDASEDGSKKYVERVLKNNCSLMQYEKGSEGETY